MLRHLALLCAATAFARAQEDGAVVAGADSGFDCSRIGASDGPGPYVEILAWCDPEQGECDEASEQGICDHVACYSQACGVVGTGKFQCSRLGNTQVGEVDLIAWCDPEQGQCNEEDHACDLHVCYYSVCGFGGGATFDCGVIAGTAGDVRTLPCDPNLDTNHDCDSCNLYDCYKDVCNAPPEETGDHPHPEHSHNHPDYPDIGHGEFEEESPLFEAEKGPRMFDCSTLGGREGLIVEALECDGEGTVEGRLLKDCYAGSCELGTKYQDDDDEGAVTAGEEDYNFDCARIGGTGTVPVLACDPEHYEEAAGVTLIECYTETCDAATAVHAEMVESAHQEL